MRYSARTALLALTALLSSTKALELDVTSQDSIRNAASTVAFGLMSYYSNNQSTTAVGDVGTFAMPVYWWEAGAVWGGMVDYYAYTGDASYVTATSNALMAQIGPDSNFLVPAQQGDEGNDDQAFWALSVMSAAENGFPQPSGKPLWADIAANTFNNITPRWNVESCGGGLKWQIYSFNTYGYDYKNSVSNGGLFQLAARLARYTSNSTYAEWAEKVWDWSVDVGFVSSSYDVYDGADDTGNCTDIDKTTWTYNNAIYLYGAAAMYAYTGDSKWQDRTNGLLKAAGSFFTEFSNVTDVMVEVCEPSTKCNADQTSFKAYLGRWMAKTAVLAPFAKNTIDTYLSASAKAAAASCSGADSACGNKWYINGFDGNTGVGQQLSALEVIQALLASNVTPGKAGSETGASSSSAVPSSTVAAVSSASTAASTPSEVVATTSSASAAVSSPAGASDAPGTFPEVKSSAVSLCTADVETVTVTVPKSSLAPTSSFCTLEIVTVTQTAPSNPITSILATGTPASSSGFLVSANATTSLPAQFTGAAAPKMTQGTMQLVGAMGAVLGAVALF